MSPSAMKRLTPPSIPVPAKPGSTDLLHCVARILTFLRFHEPQQFWAPVCANSNISVMIVTIVFSLTVTYTR